MGARSSGKGAVGADRKTATVLVFIGFPPARDGPDFPGPLLIELRVQQRAVPKIPGFQMMVSEEKRHQPKIACARGTPEAQTADAGRAAKVIDLATGG